MCIGKKKGFNGFLLYSSICWLALDRFQEWHYENGLLNMPITVNNITLTLPRDMNIIFHELHFILRAEYPFHGHDLPIVISQIC